MSVVEKRAEISDTKAAIEKVEAAIEKVEAAIEKVEAAIEKVEAKIEIEADAEVKEALRDKEKQLRDEKIILLQQQQQHQQRYASLRPPIPPAYQVHVPTWHHTFNHGSESSTSRAKILELNARQTAQISTFTPIDGKEAILDDPNALQLLKIEKKKICAFLFNAMNGCFGTRLVVDSQDFPWLSQGLGDRLKPDGFIVHKALAEIRDSTVEEVLAGTRASVNGTPVHDRYVEGEVFMIEGKLGLTLKGQLELVDCMNLVGKGVYKGMVIGREGFWLLKACNWVINVRIEGKWTDAGSMELILGFLSPPPLACAIDYVCEKLQCQISIASNGKSYLGSGATGHVFLVEKANKKMAMKLSLGSEAHGVRLESSKLLCYNCRQDADMLPLAKRWNEYSGDGITAFLMEPVGEPVIPMTTKSGAVALVEQAFDSLHKLHSANIFHGDPRLENLIRSGRHPIWIDLIVLGGQECCNPASMKSDFCALAKSFLRHLDIDASNYDSIKQLIEDDYDGQSAEKVINCLRKIIRENFKATS